MWNAHVLARSKSCFTRDPMQPFNIATWTSISPLPSQLPTMPTRDHRTKGLGEQPSNSDRKDIMQSIRVSKRYWGGHPFLRGHYDGSWTGNDQIDSLHCKRKCKEQQQLKKKKRGRGKKCSWANLLCYRQRWNHHSRNNNNKKKNPPSSRKSWPGLRTKNVLTTTGIICAGDARVS